MLFRSLHHDADAAEPKLHFHRHIRTNADPVGDGRNCFVARMVRERFIGRIWWAVHRGGAVYAAIGVGPDWHEPRGEYSQCYSASGERGGDVKYGDSLGSIGPGYQTVRV